MYGCSSYSFSKATWPRLFLHNEVINSCPIVNLEKLSVRREQKRELTQKGAWNSGSLFGQRAPKFMNKTRIENILFEPQNKAVDS
jgi:hypothetical protein